MTVKIENLTIRYDEAAWIMGEWDASVTDVTNDETYRLDILSVVRHIMRERGDCSQIPVVVAAIKHDTNQYGHNFEVEVEYSRKRNWRAIYGAHVGERVTNVQCYMD